MKKTSYITIWIAIFLSLTILAAPAYAGNVQRNRWEGIAIGLGAAILGSALFNQHQYQHNQMAYAPSEPPYEYGPPREHYAPPAYHRKQGHWEIHKEWIPPVYKKVWNPGHYDRHGQWVSGDWIRMEIKPGCWQQTKVWVAERKYRGHR